MMCEHCMKLILVSISTVLLENSHAHSFMSRLWLPSSDSDSFIVVTDCVTPAKSNIFTTGTL